MDINVGQVYRDQDRGRLFRVVFIATPESHQVKKIIAACYVGGRLTTIAAERLCNPSRFELIPQEPE